MSEVTEREQNKLIKKLTKSFQTNKIKTTIIGIIVIIVLVIAVYFGVKSAITNWKNKPREVEIISKSYIENIIEVNELSTYETIYDGVAVKQNKDNPDTVDYYVAYDAKVQAGVNVNEIRTSEDKENKIITIELPPIQITNIDVDITTMDFMFMNKNSHTDTVTQEAYKLCIYDVTKESKSTTAIYDLAKQSAENSINALLKPLFAQCAADYTLVVKSKE